MDCLRELLRKQCATQDGELRDLADAEFIKSLTVDECSANDFFDE